MLPDLNLMNFFNMKVVNELTRISNVTPGIFRKTLTDVQVNGILLIYRICKSLLFKKIMTICRVFNGLWIQPTLARTSVCYF